MNEAAALQPETVRTALRRMLPVWLVVFATAAGAIFLIRESGRRFLEAGYYSQADTCNVGEIKYLAAMKIFRALSADAAARGKDVDATNFAKASTLGAFRGDARIAEARALLKEAILRCPPIRGADEALAAIEWWDGNEALSHRHLGEEHRRLGETSMARTEFETALGLEPENTEYLLALAEELTREQRVADAAALLRTAPPQAADSPPALRILAKEAGEAGRLDEAIDFVKRALEAEPGHGDAINDLVRFGNVSGKTLETCQWAAGNLRTARAPEARSWHSLGQNFMRIGSHDLALDALDQAFAIAPNSVGVMMDRALVLHELGRDSEAVRVMELAISKNYQQYFRLLKDARFEPLRPMSQERFGAGGGQ